MKKKTCIWCGIVKPQSEYRARHRKCRTCEGKMTVKWMREHPINIMLQSARNRAKRDNVPFSLKRSDVVIPDECPILGIKLKNGDRHNHDCAPTLDRIIPEAGYVEGNVVVISHRANRIKSDATLDELTRIVNFYAITDSKYGVLRVPQAASLHPRFRVIKTEASIS